MAYAQSVSIELITVALAAPPALFSLWVRWKLLQFKEGNIVLLSQMNGAKNDAPIRYLVGVSIVFGLIYLAAAAITIAGTICWSSV